MTRALRLSLAIAALAVLALAAAGEASARTVWLCKPGATPDPCNVSLNTSVFTRGAAKVDPVFPSAPFAPGTVTAAGISLLKITRPTASTTWISEPGAYSARCSSAGGANVLQITGLDGAQTATPSPDPTWGLHLLDANIGLGNLVSLVHDEAGAYAARPSAPLAPTSGHSSR